jgi:hypothetical protein
MNFFLLFFFSLHIDALKKNGRKDCRQSLQKRVNENKSQGTDLNVRLGAAQGSAADALFDPRPFCYTPDEKSDCSQS